MAGIGKILVIRGGAIGDFVLTLPVFAALREQFPQVRLEVLGYPHIANLALAGGMVDAVRSIDAGPMARFFARDAELPPELSDYFADFSVVISYLYDPDEIFQDNLRRCFSGQFISGPHRPNESGDLHATEVFLKPLERLAIWGANPAPKLSLEDIEHRTPNIEPRTSNGTAHEAVRRSAFNVRCSMFDLRSPPLALHPGSGSKRKNWPENSWRELIERLLSETGCNVLLVGGEAEGDRLQRLGHALMGERLEIAQNLPLVELARRLAGCRGFVGHDSGISHLAAALGLPGIVLWGETRQEIWRPRSDRITLLQEASGLARLPVNRVLEEITGRLK